MLLLYNLLAWEPSAAKVTKSYSRRLPALAIKVKPFNLESQKQAKNISMGLRSSPIKI